MNASRLRALLTCVAVVCGVTGCAVVPLGGEDAVPEFVELKTAAARLPQRTELVPVRTARGQPVRLAVHETGTGAAPRVIVLLHGVLADSQSWRFVRGELGARFDLIAIDLLGCGASDDLTTPTSSGSECYAPPALARDVLAALRARLRARGGSRDVRLTLVGHSLGGMVALRMFADPEIRAEFADVLDHVDGMVLFAPVDVAVEKDVPALRAIATVTDLEVAVADASGLLRTKVADAVRGGACDGTRATREEAERTFRILQDRRRRRAAQAMINQAIPTRAGRPDWPRIEKVVAGYPQVRVPCLIVWGERDEMFSVAMGYKLAAQLPHARLLVVGSGTHCLPVERPRLCAGLVRDFIAGAPVERAAVTWMDGAVGPPPR